jgi:hypothetical protein
MQKDLFEAGAGEVAGGAGNMVLLKQGKDL